jgi:hypothetical protein
VAVTADGRLRTAGSSGVLWFWPAPVLLAIDLALAAGALWAWRCRRPDDDPGGPAPGATGPDGVFVTNHDTKSLPGMATPARVTRNR